MQKYYRISGGKNLIFLSLSDKCLTILQGLQTMPEKQAAP